VPSRPSRPKPNGAASRRDVLFPFGISVRDGTRLTFETVLRPLRIGYRVDPRSVDHLRGASETAATLWGGVLHALIPALRSRPRWWNPWRQTIPGAPAPSAAQIARSYEEAFDCDIVVDIRGQDEGSRSRGASTAEIRARSALSSVDAGLSIVPLYERLWRDEFRFDSRRRPRVVVPKPPSEELRLFVDVCFGRFPSARDDLEQRYRTSFDADDLVIAPDVLLDGFAPTALDPFRGPLSVGSYGVAFTRFGPLADPSSEPVIVLVDPRDPVDLFDLWNLRASGAPVVGIPRPWVEPLAERLAARLFDRQTRHSREWVAIYTGRRSTDESTRVLSAALSERGLKASQLPPLEASPLVGHLNAALAEASRDDVDVVAARGLVEIPLAGPPIAHTDYTSVYACMNTLTLRSWTVPPDGAVAAFIPSKLRNVTALLGALAPSHVRASKRGLEVRVSFRNEKATLRLPSGREVIAALLRQEGFEPRASDAGTVAERLIEQMGSLSDTSLLRHRGVLTLLNKAALTGVEMPLAEVASQRRVRVSFIKRAEMLRVLGVNFGARNANSVLQQLVDRQVLRLGLTLKCPACGFINWLELDAVRHSLRCERCLADFAFPEGSPPGYDSWAYRPTGACGVENFARGSYTVAQVLRVLEPFAEPMVWCTGTQLDKKLEVDLVAVRRRRDDLPRLIFGEAKTLGAFGSQDFRRTRLILRQFKDASFIFATLRDGLTRDERSQLKALARPRGRQPSDLPYHPRILVFTALELSSVDRLPECWREAGGRTADIAAAAASYVRDDVDAWADITMQIHVGLGPHADWWQGEARRLRPGMSPGAVPPGSR
jgi:hypothetical protein